LDGKISIRALAAAAAISATAVAAPAATRIRLTPRAPAAPASADGRRGYIVVLKEPPLVRAALSSGPVRPAFGRRGPAMEAAALRLRSEQDDFMREIGSRLPGVRFGARYENVLNGVAVLVPRGGVAVLRADPRVRAVLPIRRHHLHLDSSNSLMNAPAFWSALGGDGNAGKGAKIAILDTGVDFSNPMFRDDSLPMPAGFPKENDGKGFANSKVIVAKYFQSIYDSTDPGLSLEQRTAQDLSGHGSGTSSSAAGAKVALTGSNQRHVTLEGVAPKAYIGDYKVFTPNAYTDNIIAAIDAAVADGMDVLNMSFGFTLGVNEPNIYGFDVENEAIQNAIAAGVSVAISAGNGGPDADTISADANIPEVIAVGASTNSHDGFGSDVLGKITVTGGSTAVPPEIAKVVGTRGSGTAPPLFPSTPIAAPLADFDNLDGVGAGTACSSVVGAPLTGDIALIQRGTCTFVSKVQNAALAGAVAVVIYNSADGGDSLLFADVSGTSIPTIFVGRTDGLNLKAYLDANAGPPPSSAGTFGPATGEPPLVFTDLPVHDVADFSSTGPTLDLQIKPDLVTIGTGSYMAVEDDDPLGAGRFNDDFHGQDDALYDVSGFTFAGGTSFSSPRAAGAAALLMQKNPGWDPERIKAALMETSSRQIPDATDAAAVGNLGVQLRGSGEIDLAAAAAAESIVLPANHSFRRIALNNLPDPAPLSKTFTVENHSSAAATYQVSATAFSGHGDPAIVPSATPSSLTVAAGQTGTFTLTLALGAGLQTGENDSEGFVSVSDGGQTIAGTLHVPYWVRVAYKNGSAPDLQSMTAAADPTSAHGNPVHLIGNAHDGDGDIASAVANVYDDQDFELLSYSGSFSGTSGIQDLSFDVTLPGATGSDCQTCTAVTLQLFDSKGNASGTLFARFAPPGTEAIPSSASTRQRTFPLLAHAQGTKFFQSDVELFNPDRAHILPLDLYFTPQSGTAAVPLHTTHLLAPGQSLALDDEILSDFKLSNSFGSVTAVSKEGKDFLATSHTYDEADGGTFGTSAPAVPPESALGPGGGTATANGLPTGSGFHTNVGATEVTGHDATVFFEGFDAAGNSLGSASVVVAAHTNVQFNPVETGHFSALPARIDFKVLSGGSVIPYGVSVDDGSGDLSLFIASPVSESGQDRILAELGHTEGANGTFFVSDMAITNRSASGRTFEVSTMSGSTSVTKSLTLSSGETRLLSDVLVSLFGLSGNVATGVRIHPTTPAAFAASARTFTSNTGAGAGQFGFFLTPAAGSDAIGLGETAIGLGAAQNGQFRTNFVLTEVSGAAVTVRATVLDAFGTPMGSRDYAVGANSTVSDALGDVIAAASAANATILFEPISGSGHVIATLAVVDNVSGDAIAIPAEKKP